MQYVRVHAVESVDMALVQRLREEIQRLQITNAKLRAPGQQRESQRKIKTTKHDADAIFESTKALEVNNGTHKVLSDVLETLQDLKGKDLQLSLINAERIMQNVDEVTKQTVHNTKDLGTRFFDFEIEEDEFKREFSSRIKTALLKFTNATDKAKVEGIPTSNNAQRAFKKFDNFVAETSTSGRR